MMLLFLGAGALIAMVAAVGGYRFGLQVARVRMPERVTLTLPPEVLRAAVESAGAFHIYNEVHLADGKTVVLHSGNHTLQ